MNLFSTTITTQDTFSTNSEAVASELVENLCATWTFMLLAGSKLAITHRCVTRCERVTSIITKPFDSSKDKISKNIKIVTFERKKEQKKVEK